MNPPEQSEAKAAPPEHWGLRNSLFCVAQTEVCGLVLLLHGGALKHAMAFRAALAVWKGAMYCEIPLHKLKTSTFSALLTELLG